MAWLHRPSRSQADHLMCQHRSFTVVPWGAGSHARLAGPRGITYNVLAACCPIAALGQLAWRCSRLSISSALGTPYRPYAMVAGDASLCITISATRARLAIRSLGDAGIYGRAIARDCTSLCAAGAIPDGVRVRCIQIVASQQSIQALMFDQFGLLRSPICRASGGGEVGCRSMPQSRCT